MPFCTDCQLRLKIPGSSGKVHRMAQDWDMGHLINSPFPRGELEGVIAAALTPPGLPW
jgi:hypothetical protein